MRREVYAWLSVQMAPILAYWLWRDGPRRLNWLVPLFVLTSIVTLLTGPIQTVLAYLVASTEMRRRWFIVYGVLAILFYTGFKNLITRVAQVKEAVGERRWVVTPRAAPGASRQTGGRPHTARRTPHAEPGATGARSTRDRPTPYDGQSRHRSARAGPNPGASRGRRVAV